MIGALFALALLMILGGLASVVQGIPYVRLEIGWTMVIAGTVGASGGALLLGLAVAVTRLARIERLLAQPAASGPRAEPHSFPGPGPATRPAEPLPPPPAMPFQTAGPAPAGPGNAGTSTPEGTAPEPAAASAIAAALGGAGVAGAAALAAPAPAAAPDAAAADAAAPELRLTRAEPDPAEEPEPAPAETPPDSPAPAPSAEAAETAPEPAAPEEPAIVGTYASGGNTYVMYADGTIDAQTPGGKYRFTSLDELKVFIAEGGEAGGEMRSGAA
ncbi:MULTISPECIES: hypothetical protein [unclassified Methylobacterium]|uniref:hypothetical protein n=1 Tax=unclassified Methylobacterium TaxID=2615210 RepID=UPI000152E18A|nr:MULTISPECIES: hypothetical protein [Methylobacterium]WFT78823.1 hypothetical protein QA634_26700 [Methylobacterium nodulans]